MSENPPVLHADPLARLSHVRHGFFTRRGGVSEGIYASLNCGPGSDDVLDRVAENQARAANRLGAAAGALVTLHQVHGVDVKAVEAPWPMTGRPRADGMVTTRPGVALGILTADCAPVLFADAEAGVIGAAHAGWRGALAGVVEATVHAMVRLGADARRIAAAVGPCIGGASYEVGPEFPAPFLLDDKASARFFTPARREGHFLFALADYVLARLARAGVGEAHALGRDTCAEADDFFSYRRTTLEGGRKYGRNLSAIMLAGE